MTTFVKGKQAELKDGWVNGHRVSTAHVKGSDAYTVKVDNHAEVTLSSAEALARYIWLMTQKAKQ